MDTMDTMGHYRLYVALLQNPIDSPGFADAVRSYIGISDVRMIEIKARV